jgi:hypothetical protein
MLHFRLVKFLGVISKANVIGFVNALRVVRLIGC